MRYAELQITTNFSFLRGASHADELAAFDGLVGYLGLASDTHQTVQHKHHRGRHVFVLFWC